MVKKIRVVDEVASDDSVEEQEFDMNELAKSMDWKLWEILQIMQRMEKRFKNIVVDDVETTEDPVDVSPDDALKTVVKVKKKVKSNIVDE
tara:strand:- start:1078 stop:1347 length:270 start_codon:yes stop_codon:yes gene_type:complete